MWVSGGIPDDRNENLQDVEIYNLDTASWSPGPLLTKARSSHSMHVVNGNLIVAGGKGGWQSLEILIDGVWKEEETYFTNYHLDHTSVVVPCM